MSSGERIVVVGTGGAGLRAAERVRELDFAGELVIIGEEPYRPYHRPMLSKQVLTGTIRPREVLLPTHSDLGAMWRPKTRASKLDPEEHIVYLPGGEEIDYDGLIIATGMQAAHLPGAPRHDPRIHVLRTVTDAMAVQKLLASGKGRVAVIGGGFLAGEVASAARELGRDTTIIIRESAMLDQVPGFDVSETVTALHEAAGVRLVTDATVQHWHTESADGLTMHLSTGEVVVADCVVLCVGGVPATDWLRGSGLLVDEGVLCGPTTHALGVDDVVVAGDVARWPNLRFDTVPRRVEHWMNAVEMGRAAAEALLAGRDAAAPFTPLPKFWSEQHGIRIQGAGLPTLAQDTVPLTESVPIGSKITGYVAGGSLVGILAWDSPRGMLHYNRELYRQTTAAMHQRLAQEGQPAQQPQQAPQAPPAPLPQAQQGRPVPQGPVQQGPPVQQRTPVPQGPPVQQGPPVPQGPPVQQGRPARPMQRAGNRPPARPLPPPLPQQTLQPMPAMQAPPRPAPRQPVARPPVPQRQHSGQHPGQGTGQGYAPMYAPLHASMTGPIPRAIPAAVPVPIYDPPPVDPAQYTPPASGSASAADPAVTELPPIDSWRMAS
jgi:NADPH-dependent 2,4-dienoyl-CoA reductase/sulfur reductase-like enzyme